MTNNKPDAVFTYNQPQNFACFESFIGQCNSKDLSVNYLSFMTNPPIYAVYINIRHIHFHILAARSFTQLLVTRYCVESTTE